MYSTPIVLGAPLLYNCKGAPIPYTNTNYGGAVTVMQRGWEDHRLSWGGVGAR